MKYRFNELNWVDFLKQRVKKNKDVIIGIGDDCALVNIAGKKIILKSDLFIEDVHFKLNDVSFETIGMRAVSRVLSDLAACAGTPKFLGVSLGASRHINEKEIKKIFKGITTLSNKYNFSLIGGDTSRASKLFLDVWAVGVCDKFIKRSTALEGDYIFITGKLGKRKFNQNFTPRLKEAQYLVSNFKINSMIDISDGFIIDLYRILKESNAGAFLYKTAIPLAKPNDLYRGEDYELIFTVSKNEKKIALLKSKFYFVGVVKDRQFGYKIESGSKLYDVNIKGYTHF